MASLHPLHRLWRLLPAEGRRALFARGLARIAPRPDANPPAPRHGIAIAGELSRASGLGEGARLMRDALGRLGVAHWEIDVGDGLPGSAHRAQPLPPPAAPLVLHVNAPSLPWALLRAPRGVLRGRRVIGYWAWELPRVPDTWTSAPRFLHEVWVPSHFTAAAITPILPADGRVMLRVVPHPLALAPPRVASLGRADFGLPEEAVVVLVSFNLASGFARKNPLAAIAAFKSAFGTRPDRVLLLKVTHTEPYPDDFARLRAAADAPNIRIETRTLPDADRHALTRSSDIVLSLHRSEGFGLVPAEAMLLGKPVVATGWSGNMDFMNAENSALVEYRLVPARDPRGVYDLPDVQWADPDVAQAAEWLARLADDAGLRAAMGTRASESVGQSLGGGLRAAVAALGLTHCGPTA